MQIPEIKRRLEEVKALYELEPCLRDLYVEGPSDLYIMTWFLRGVNRRDVHVYPIDFIELPEQMSAAHGLDTHSNRNKVILLSEELTGHFREQRIKAKCIVDADYDRCTGACKENYALLYTDYTSMEMYLFSVDFIEKFTELVLGGLPVAPAALHSNLKEVLQTMFVIHLTNEVLGWQMQWVDVARYISCDKQRIRFRADDFLKAYLMRNGQLSRIAQFRATMNDLAGRTDPDARHNIRGHDYTYVLFLTAKRLRRHRCGFTNLAAFESAFCGCIELRFVENEVLFQKVRTL
jgi:hypothetical protein